MERQELYQLSENWGNIHYNDQIVLYGVGRIGRRVLPTLMKEFRIPFLIDQRGKGTEVFGKHVLGIKEGVTRVKEENIKIVITTMRGAYQEIAEGLEQYGLVENKDFCIFERFAEEWNLRWQNKCVLAKIDTVITSKCTLKCKNCNIFISHIKGPTDISFERLKKNFDIFFDTVDFVYEYTLLGGEPFLHRELSEILVYLNEIYGDKIGRINLISNGTVVPKGDLIAVMKKYQVSVHISDYTISVPCREKLEEVKTVLQENQIDYYVIPNNTWKDIVYPDLSYTAENPREHMLICGHSTHSVGDGKLYWCDPAYAADCFMGYPSKEDDYLDLEANRRTHKKQEASENILHYFLGDMNERGYMSICEKCAGIGNDNDRVVKAGEQRKE